MEVLKEESSENPKYLLAVLRFIQGLTQFTVPECLEDILEFLRTTVGRFLGVPDSLKSSCCDTLSCLVRYKVVSADLALEFLPSLGYSCVSNAASWQLKDSALQVQLVIHLLTSFPFFSLVNLPSFLNFFLFKTENFSFLYLN